MKKFVAFVIGTASLFAGLFFGVMSAGAAPITNATTVTGIPNTPADYSHGIAADDHYVWYANASGGQTRRDT